MWAAYNGHLPCVTALVEAKADLNLQNKNGKSLISGLSQSLARLRWSSVPLSLSLALCLSLSLSLTVCLCLRECAGVRPGLLLPWA